jgi:hypothetical protein
LNGSAGDKEIVAESAAQLIARSSSHRETLATFRAAPGENQTTRSRGHAGAKAVRALSMQIARLVRTLHGGISRGKFFSKVPLKQAHGGAERRAARVRSTSLSVKRVAAFRRRSGVRNFARPGCG